MMTWDILETPEKVPKKSLHLQYLCTYDSRSHLQKDSFWHLFLVKEYAQTEEVSARFGVDSVSASDLSCGIGVSETAEYLEKVQPTSAGPYIDLVPGKKWDWHVPDAC